MKLGSGFILLLVRDLELEGPVANGQGTYVDGRAAGGQSKRFFAGDLLRAFRDGPCVLERVSVDDGDGTAVQRVVTVIFIRGAWRVAVARFACVEEHGSEVARRGGCRDHRAYWAVDQDRVFVRGRPCLASHAFMFVDGSEPEDPSSRVGG